MNRKGQIVFGLLSIGIATFMNIYLSAIGHYSIYFVVVSVMWIIMSWGIGKYIDRLQEAIMFDSLTKAYCRKAAVKQYRRLVTRVRRTNGKVAVYFLDVDNFKHINDNYGHNAGDKVLRSIAKQLLKLQLPGKTVVRWGGDEFVVMIPCRNEQEVLSALQMIDNSMQSISRQGSIEVSMSIGTAVSSQLGDRLEQLIELADRQMLWNKRRKKLDKLDTPDMSQSLNQVCTEIV